MRIENVARASTNPAAQSSVQSNAANDDLLIFSPTSPGMQAVFPSEFVNQPEQPVIQQETKPASPVLVMPKRPAPLPPVVVPAQIPSHSEVSEMPAMAYGIMAIASNPLTEQNVVQCYAQTVALEKACVMWRKDCTDYIENNLNRDNAAVLLQQAFAAGPELFEKTADVVARKLRHDLDNIQRALSADIAKKFVALVRTPKLSDQPVAIGTGHTDMVLGLCPVGSGGANVYSASADLTIKLWGWGDNGRTFQKAKTYKGHSDKIYGLCASRDGSLLFSGSSDNTIKVWDARSKSCIKTLKGHNKLAVYALCWHNDVLYSGSADQTIKAWDVKSGRELRTFAGHNSIIWSLAASGDKLFSCGIDHTIRIWDIKTGQCLKTLEGHKTPVHHVQVIGNDIISCARDQTIRVWDIETGVCQRVLNGHADTVYQTARVTDQTIVSCSLDKSLRLWNFKTGELLQTIPNAHSKSIYSVCVFLKYRFRQLTGSLFNKFCNSAI